MFEDFDEYSQKIRQKLTELHQELPIIIAGESNRFVADNFRNQYYQSSRDKIIHWKKRKNTKNKRRLLVGKTGLLSTTVKAFITSGSVIIKAPMVYAEIHNEGGDIQHPGGTAYVFVGPKKVKFISNKKANKPNKKGIVKPVQRTQAHLIKMPQRQFLPTSQKDASFLFYMIDDRVLRRLQSIFKEAK